MMLTSNLASVLFMERNEIMAIKFSFSIFIQSQICCFSSLQNILGLIDCCERVFISNRAKRGGLHNRNPIKHEVYLFHIYNNYKNVYCLGY